MGTELQRSAINNFGLQGLINLPTAKTLPSGELIFYQNNHTALSRTGLSFQINSKIGVSFRYSGHGKDGSEAAGRINHDRSFDIDFNLFNEKKFLPALSFGLRDFIGTGWYSSEYVVGTKTIGAFDISGGLGFGRLAGRSLTKNPFGLNERKDKIYGKGGTLGNINWFRGPASPFFGLKYDINKKTAFILEYFPDLMQREAKYLEISSPLNVGVSYNLNDFISLNTQYLYGSTLAVGANIQLNPKRPPYGNGINTAPIPFRKRDVSKRPIKKTKIIVIKNLLEAEKFIVNDISQLSDHIKIEVENTKYRSNAMALGRISRILQRLSSDQNNFAIITILSKQFPIASYHLDLKKLVSYNNSIESFNELEKIIIQRPSPDTIILKNKSSKFQNSISPYLDYKLFDPQQPIRAEIGLKLSLGYQLSSNFGISGILKKSILTDLDENNRVSNSELPHVLSDFAVYDKEGQGGHLHNLKITHKSKILKNIYSSISAGYLEPMYAGISSEILHKSPKSNLAFGLDITAVQMRDFNMQFGLRNYKTITSHFNLYYDAGSSFDLEMNIGRYLAKDFGVTTKLSRRFGNGWSVGAYATLTDVPFDTFGEGSFDKGFYLNVPMDWIIGIPTKARRNINIRPITRDGGAILASSKTIYNSIKESNQSELKREYGRFLK